MHQDNRDLTLDEGIVRELISRSEVQIANYREYRQRSGANFNVFKILNRATDEVYGHSALIAELLNPLGSHAQGDTFLRLFFSFLGIEKDVAGIDHWQVTVEESRGVDGRIDILLAGRGSSGRRFGIAIENKIYADDEKRQLSRYWRYLNNQYGPYRPPIPDQEPSTRPYLLYYLTLSGYAPSAQSIADIPTIELSYVSVENSEAPVRLLSYADHVREWLKLCHEKLAFFPYAREVIGQYMGTINSLTGNGEGMSKGLNLLLDTPEKLFAASQLSNAVTLFRKSLLCELWDMILAEWKMRSECNDSCLTGELQANRHLVDSARLKKVSNERFSKSRNVPRWFGFVSKAYEMNSTHLGLEIRFDNRFYVGLYGEKKEKDLDKTVVESFYQNFQLSKGCELGSYDDKLVKERIYINTPVRFDTDNDALFQLIELKQKEELVATIFEVAEGIISEMDKFGLQRRQQV